MLGQDLITSMIKTKQNKKQKTKNNNIVNILKHQAELG